MELIVVGFPEKHKADEVMLEILKSDSESLLNFEDIVVVTKNIDGKIRIKPYFDLLSEARGVKSKFWGDFIIKIFHKDEASLEHIGLDKKFRQKVKDTIPLEGSAIFMLVHKNLAPEVLVKRVMSFNGMLLRTALIHDNATEIYSCFQ